MTSVSTAMRRPPSLRYFFLFLSPTASLLATLAVFAIAFGSNFLASHDRLLHSGIVSGFVPP